MKMWEKEFKAMLEYAIEQQCEMLKFQIAEAAEIGVDIQLQLDPTKVPMGVSVYFVDYGEEFEEKPNPFKIVSEEDDD